MNMKTRHLILMLLALLISSCGTIAPAPTPTAIPLPPPQYAEAAFQWLETHAMLKDNLDWAALRNDTAEIIASARTTADTLPALCLAIRRLKDGNAWLLVPGLETPNFYTGYYTLYPENSVVIRIDTDSPAEKAGLQVGDRIEQVNGQAPIPYEEMDAFPPCNEKPVDASLLEHLTIDRNGQFIEMDVKKTQLTSGNDPYYAPRSQRLESNSSGIGYLELTLESGNHSQYPGDIQKLMRKMDKEPVCGWIIDLRRNPGGDIWSYIAAVGPLLGEGGLGGFRYLDGKREPWTYQDGQVLWNNEYRYESEIDGSIYTPKQITPVALLISPGTRAAAELLWVAFQGRADARTFGEPTRGLPTLVTHTDLSDGTVLFASGANSYDRNGRVYSSPIQPDVSVGTNWSQFGTAQDAVITAAVDWFRSQPACTQ
jgi:carboxyl-terminal processing protease